MTESERLAHVEVPTMFGWLMFKYNMEGVQLSKICVYDMPPGATPHIMVLMPLDNDREDSIYELDMVNQDMHNQDIIAEHARATTGTDHACMMIMTGKVKHECTLPPVMTSHYKCPLAVHSAVAKNKAVCIELVDGTCTGHGGAKTHSSSISFTAGFTDLTCPVNRL